MPMYDGRNGKAFYRSGAVARTNKAGSNGTVRPQILLSDPGDYGPRIRAEISKSILMPDRLMQKAAFGFESPARNTGMGAFKEETNMRGRSKGAYNIVSGFKGQRMALTTPESGSSVAGVGQVNRITAPPEGYVEISMGGLSGSGDLWTVLYNNFVKDIQGFHFLTTASQELRAFNKGKAAVDVGNQVFANTPQMMVGIIGISGELDRWLDERGDNITGVKSGEPQKSIGTIQARLLKAINFMNAALGIAKVSPQWPDLPSVPVPTPEQAATQTAIPGVTAVAVPESWFQRNKTMVIGGAVLAMLVGGFVWYQKQR